MSTWTVNVKRMPVCKDDDDSPVVWTAKVLDPAGPVTKFTADDEKDLREQVRLHCIGRTHVPDGKVARAIVKRTWEVTVQVHEPTDGEGVDQEWTMDDLFN